MELTEKKKSNWLNVFVIITFVILYALTSSISMIHIVDFFELSNSKTMSWVLSIGFEVGAAASLAALTILDKLKKELVIAIFVLLTLLQAMGNVYYSFTNLEMAEIKDWVDLFGLNLMEPVQQRRIISIVSGLPLPLIALGFIKSLTDYLKPEGNHTVFDKEEDSFVPEKTVQEPETQDTDEYKEFLEWKNAKNEVLEEDDEIEEVEDETRDDAEFEVDEEEELDYSEPEDDEDYSLLELEKESVEQEEKPKRSVDEENRERFERAQTHTEMLADLDDSDEDDIDKSIEIENKENNPSEYNFDEDFYSELSEEDHEELSKRTVSLKELKERKEREFENEKRKRGFTDDEIDKMKTSNKENPNSKTPRLNN